MLEKACTCPYCSPLYGKRKHFASWHAVNKHIEREHRGKPRIRLLVRYREGRRRRLLVLAS